MRLYLVQHGEAVSKEKDPERPLTARGRADIEAVLDLISRRELVPDRVLHSGKSRARQTAEIIGERLRPAYGVAEADGLDPDADATIWRERLKDDARSLMLVGHLPHLGKLASLLLAGDAERGTVAFRPGGIVCLELVRTWSLQWMVTPRVCGRD